MAAGSIVIDLLMRTGSFETDSKRAEKRLQEMEKSVKQVATAIGVATAAAAGVFATMTKAAIDNADRLAKLAQSTGITTEALSELEYAAGLSGASSDELTAALGRLNKSATEAANGLTAPAEAYRKLGVAVTDAAGQMKSGEDLLTEVSEAFSQLEDGPAKAALAMELFGRSGAKLIPFLNSGRAGLQAMREEAQAFGLTVDGQAAKAAEVFNDNLSRLQAAATGVTNQMAQRMLPAFVQITTAMVDTAKESKAVENIVTGLAVVFETVAVLGVELAFVLTGIGRELGGLAAQAVAVAKLDFSGAGVIGDAMKEDAAAARKEVDQLTASILGARAAAAQPFVGPPAPATPATRNAVPFTVGKTPSTGAPKVSDLQRLSKAFADQAATIGLTSEEVELYRYKLAGANPSQLAFAASVQDSIAAFKAQAQALTEGQSVMESTRTPAEAYAAEIERLNELLDRGAVSQETYSRAVFEAQDAFSDTQESIKQMRADQEALSAMLDATPTAKLEETRAAMFLLRDAFVAGRIGAEEYIEAVQTRLGTLPETIEKSTDAMSAFSDQAARNMQSAFADFLFDPFAGGVDGMLKSFGDTLKRMAAEAAAAQIFEAIGGWGKSNSGSGGILGVIGTIASAFGGARAEGGPVSMGKTYLVGERGPELFRPGTSGSIVPNEALGRATRSGGSTTINVTVNGGSAPDVRRAAGQGAREALSAFSGAQRYQ